MSRRAVFVLIVALAGVALVAWLIGNLPVSPVSGEGFASAIAAGSGELMPVPTPPPLSPTLLVIGYSGAVALGLAAYWWLHDVFERPIVDRDQRPAVMANYFAGR